jgi:hypothetical protein
MTDWHDLGHVFLHRMASHPSRTLNPVVASCCVLASPIAGHGTGPVTSTCRRGLAEAHRLRSLGVSACLGRPIVVVDGPDADGLNTALCEALWSGEAGAAGLADPLVRVRGCAGLLKKQRFVVEKAMRHTAKTVKNRRLVTT